MPSYTFEEAHLNKLLFFSDTVLPLYKQGLVLVKGDFESGTQNRNSNESGKSLLFSSIPLLLQGQLPTGKMSAKDSSPLDVGLQLKIGKEQYKIALRKNKYRIHKNNKSITPHKKPDALKLIKSLFPEETIFNSISFVSQFSSIYSSLISGTPAIRLKIIEDFLDQSKIYEWKSRLKARNDLTKRVLEKRNDLAVEMNTHKKELNKLPKVKKADIKDLINDKNTVETKLSSIRKKYSAEKITRSNAIKYKKIKSKLKIKGKTAKQIKERLKTLQKQLKHLQNSIDIVEPCETELKTYISLGKPAPWYWEHTNIPPIVKPAKKPVAFKESKVKELLEEHQDLEFDRSILVQSRSKFKQLRGKKKCPTCETLLKDKKISNLIEDLNSRIKVFDSKIRKVRIQLAPAQAMRQIYESVKEVSKEVLADYESYGLKKLMAKAERIDREISFLNKQLPLVISIKHIKPVKLNGSSKKLRRYKKQIQDLEDNLEDIIKGLERTKSNYTRRKILLKQIKKLHSKRTKLSKITKKDTIYLPILMKAISSRELKTEVTMDFCEMLVSDWNLFSHELFTKKITFSVGIEQGYPAFQFAYKNSSAADIRHLSGGAKKRLIACMIPSLLKISPTPTNILVVDELDANIDTSGREALMDFFPKILNSDLGKDSIFFLTASTKLFHPEYKNWIVRRVGNKSSLITG
jgi:DNA repair exonuclease SbcCD ATPase subunit